MRSRPTALATQKTASCACIVPYEWGDVMDDLISYDKYPRISPVDLKMHYDNRINWASMGYTDIATARKFALNLIAACDDIERIKREFEATQ